MQEMLTPSTSIGRYVGMNPYFIETANNLEFALGREIVDVIKEPYASLNAQQTTRLLENLFPAKINIYNPNLRVVEDFLLNQKAQLFENFLRSMSNNWLKQANDWVAQEKWAQDFIDGKVSLHIGQSQYDSRISDVIKTTLSLMDKKTLESYYFHWNKLMQITAYSQPVKPTDLYFFLSGCSFAKSLQKIVALEWVRNAKEGFTVNNREKDIDSFSLADAFL